MGTTRELQWEASPGSLTAGDCDMVQAEPKHHLHVLIHSSQRSKRSKNPWIRSSSFIHSWFPEQLRLSSRTWDMCDHLQTWKPLLSGAIPSISNNSGEAEKQSQSCPSLVHPSNGCRGQGSIRGRTRARPSTWVAGSQDTSYHHCLAGPQCAGSWSQENQARISCVASRHLSHSVLCKSRIS